MRRWPIFVSLVLGIGALGSAWLANAVLQTPHPDAAVVCWLMAITLMLGCMAFAQEDGLHLPVEQKEEK